MRPFGTQNSRSGRSPKRLYSRDDRPDWRRDPSRVSGPSVDVVCAEPESLKVVAAIAQAGRSAFYEQNANAIVDRIIPMLLPKDVVVIFGNSGFDNIHEKPFPAIRPRNAASIVTKMASEAILGKGLRVYHSVQNSLDLSVML